VVLAELQLQRADDRDGDDGGTREHLLCIDERRQVDRGDAVAQPERLLARPDALRVVLPRPLLHRFHNLPEVATTQLIEMPAEGREAFTGVLRFYDLAKRQEWQGRGLPGGGLPPVPGGEGTPPRGARRNDKWRSVLAQPLQAGMRARATAPPPLYTAP